MRFGLTYVDFANGQKAHGEGFRGTGTRGSPPATAWSDFELAVRPVKCYKSSTNREAQLEYGKH